MQKQKLSQALFEMENKIKTCCGQVEDQINDSVIMI